MCQPLPIMMMIAAALIQCMMRTAGGCTLTSISEELGMRRLRKGPGPGRATAAARIVAPVPADTSYSRRPRKMNNNIL